MSQLGQFTPIPVCLRHVRFPIHSDPFTANVFSLGLFPVRSIESVGTILGSISDKWGRCRIA